MLRFAPIPFVALGLAAGLPAQNPGELSPRDKTEVFIQHLVKVARIDPNRYRALVLEYEIGTALSELAHEGHHGKAGDAGKTEPDGDKSCCTAAGVALTGNFIRSALQEIHPEYARALKLEEEGKLAGARDLAKTLEAKADPYLAAHARLLLAEVDYSAALETKDKSGFERVISLCERIGQKDRLYLVDDHRACELIALSYGKLEKTLHEFVQYAILLTDYYDLPPEVEMRVKAKLAALGEENGKPLGTVATWMNKVEKLLGKEITARDPTQAQETEIVSALDKLIELQEARERRT